MTPVEDATAVPRPTPVETFYLEHEFDARSTEQRHLHGAHGEKAANRSTSLAAGLEPGSVETAYAIDTNRPLIEAALAHYLSVKTVLSPFVTRKGSTLGYTLRNIGLFAGDITGLGGAAITYGEQPVLALCQAGSAGVATITAGLVGAQFKHYQLAVQRQMDPDTVSEEVRPYLPLLDGPRFGRTFVMAVTAVGAAIALVIGCGIFVLRSSVEGSAAGVTFGLLALGIAAASWINSYSYADPVADAIQAARRDYEKEQRRHRRLARSRWLVLSQGALERARVIRQEHQKRGEAASHHVQALKLEAMALSPDVVGHGYGRVIPPRGAKRT